MIIELGGKTPRVAEDAFIAPTAVLIGDVTVEAGASIWFGAVLRGDNSAIVIGAGSNVQDNCVIHCADELPTIVGENVTVGHMAMLERPAEVNHDIRVFARSCLQRFDAAENGTRSHRRSAKNKPRKAPTKKPTARASGEVAP